MSRQYSERLPGHAAGYVIDAEPGMPWLPILMYHRVVPQVLGPDTYGQQVTVAQFEAQMRFLHLRGYRSLFLAEAEQAAGRGKLPWRKPVIITFDDGYEDNFTQALPILERYQLRATVMLPSHQIGKASGWYPEGESQVPLLNLGQAREMARYGVQFGSHSKTHRSLTGMDAAEAQREIVESKAALEQALGTEVRSFSYPFGRSNPALRAMVQEAGYAVACGIEQRDHSLFNLSRVDAASCHGSGLAWRWKVPGFHHRLRRNSGLRRLKATLLRSPRG